MAPRRREGARPAHRPAVAAGRRHRAPPASASATGAGCAAGRRSAPAMTSLLPSGEGAPQGRMRVRAQPRAASERPAWIREGFAPDPHPNPSPGGEGLKRAAAAPYLFEAMTSLLPPGEGAPQGRMRVRAQPRAASESPGWFHESFAPYPHPNPSPGGRGAKARFDDSLSFRSHDLPSPPGEGAPKGRMRARTQPRAASESPGWSREGFGHVPSPQPLSRGERGLSALRRRVYLRPKY